ncbi:hypothetical protein CQA38_03320 [Campylobacter sp. MIT 12-5580]|uniref:DMT family transporter n=1 Tax=Campylobacter sp. MIT 12-5580 TaxID=2040651 RepID=UPI0010F8A686|nr:DMT family transporter [Campylobacter sp. MIT 12-5580]TKX29810.1 hypothetical protein CQA38_03320 [Campylobacter sp. MIT 12-5580]
MIYYLTAFCMGLAIAMQAPINASLARSLQSSPLIGALVSFLVGLICLVILSLFLGFLNVNLIKNLFQQSWWLFLGGVLGAFFVFGTVLLAPKIGLINMFLLVLVGQLITSLALDKIGAFGLEIKEISVFKIAGLAVIIIGLLIFFYKELKTSF